MERETTATSENHHFGAPTGHRRRQSRVEATCRRHPMLTSLIRTEETLTVSKTMWRKNLMITVATAVQILSVAADNGCYDALLYYCYYDDVNDPYLFARRLKSLYSTVHIVRL